MRRDPQAAARESRAVPESVGRIFGGGAMSRTSSPLALTLLATTIALCTAGAAHALDAPRGRPLRVAVVITEGATMIDFGGPWEVFQDVHVPERGESMEEQMPFALFTVGAAKKPVQISGGMTVVPDYTFADAPAPDIVVIGAQRGAPELGAWLKRMHAEKRLVMSVCTGAFHLAQAGLLDGKPATTHHDFIERMKTRHPQVKVVQGDRFVQSDPLLYCAGGLTSGIDLALHVVELYFGREAAQRTATYMEYQSTGWIH
jgi:transcriptional regulator GlxA family with amidase domain